jgi:hypothetical protein
MRPSKAELAESAKSDCVIAYMIDNNLAINRASYLDLAYMGNAPEPLGVEEEASLPHFLQDWRVRHAEGE